MEGEAVSPVQEFIGSREQENPAASYLKKVAETWHGQRVSAVKRSTYDAFPKGLDELQQELEDLKVMIDKIPPEVFSLLIKDVSVDPSAMSKADMATMLECVKSYGTDWTVSKDPDPVDASKTRVTIQSGFKPDGFGGYPPRYISTMPKFLEESASLHPQWQQKTETRQDGQGHKFNLPTFVGSSSA